MVGLRGADRPWTPAVDLIETPTDVLVDVDLPGIDPVLVDVSLTGNMLTVQGPKRTHIPPQGGTVHVAERMQGPFQGVRFPMPTPVIADSVSAEMKNGVLQIRLMKSEKARSTKITGPRGAAATVPPRLAGVCGARSLTTACRQSACPNPSALNRGLRRLQCAPETTD